MGEVMTEMEKAIEAMERGDYATAFKISLPLAEQGDADAQNKLGFMYDDGLGVPQDYAEAMKWYRNAAEQGQRDFNALTAHRADFQGGGLIAFGPMSNPRTILTA